MAHRLCPWAFCIPKMQEKKVEKKLETMAEIMYYQRVRGINIGENA